MRTNLDEKEIEITTAALDKLHGLLDSFSVYEKDGYGYWITEEDNDRIAEAQKIVEDTLEHVFDAL